MSIDGIGKPSGLPPGAVGGAGAGVPASGAEGAFHALASGPEEADAASRVSGSDALRALERGELSVDEYLEVRVTEATRHLSTLPPEQLELVRDTLRDQLRTDPVLLELVRRATGAVLE